MPTNHHRTNRTHKSTALTRPDNPDTLHEWVRLNIGVELTREPLLSAHSAPFDYLVHTYFEGAFPIPDHPAPRCSNTRPRHPETATPCVSPADPGAESPTHGVPATPPCSEKNPASKDVTTENTSTYDKTPARFSRPIPDPSRSFDESLDPSKDFSILLDPSPPPPSPLPASPLPLDSVIWANRGGGKTFLAALATLLDLLFKPAIHVTILGGSLEQSQRMHEHLRKFFEHTAFASELAAPITDRRVLLKNKSRATVLAQSQASVRGTRVQKLRCDEVDLFDPQIWSAVQLTTRSLRVPDTGAPWGTLVRASIDALSTMHQPHGLMWNIVTSATSPITQSPRHPVPQSNSSFSPSPLLSVSPSSPRTLFRWGLLDTLQHCLPERTCETCALHPECQGRAKSRAGHAGHAGHINIDDAIRMKSRVSDAAWKSEMLCITPRRTDSVYPEFDRGIHVGDWEHDLWCTSACLIRAETLELGESPFIAGMDFGFRAPTVILLAWINAEGTLYIEAENVESERTLDHHIRVLTSGAFLTPSPSHPLTPSSPFPRPAWVGVDPAGNQRSPHTGISSCTQLRKAGLTVRARRMELLQGVELVRARLKPATSAFPSEVPTHLRPGIFPPPRASAPPRSHDSSSPRLFIHKRCHQLIDSLERYHFPPDNPHALEPVKDGADHCADALRYLILNLDKPYAPIGVIRYA